MENQLNKSKISFLEKTIWKIKYRELYKSFGNDIFIMKSILHNKDVRECYDINKSEIDILIKNIEEVFPKQKKQMFNILIYSIQTKKFEIVKNNINNIAILGRGLLEEENTSNSKEDDFEKKLDENISDAKKRVLDYFESIFEERKDEILTNPQISNIIYEKLEEVNEEKEIKAKLIERKKQVEENIEKYDLSNEDKKIYLNGVKNGEIESDLQAFLKLRSNKSIYNENALSYRVGKVIRENIKYSEYFLVNSDFADYEEISCINNAIKNTNMTITDILLARGAYIDTYIDDKINENNISEVKKYMQLKYIGIPYEILPDKNKMINKSTQRTINIGKIIEDAKSIEDLEKIRKNLDYRRYFVSQFDLEEIVNEGKNEKLEGLFRVKDYKKDEQQFTEYKGKKIQVINLKGEDYKGIIHVCINMNVDDQINKADSYNKKQNLNLCTSIIQDEHMNLAWQGEMKERTTRFGFSENIEMFQFSNQDAGTYPLKEKKTKEKFYPSVYSNTRNKEYWNEPIDIYENRYNEASIYKKKPDYIFCIGEITEIDKEWAMQFDIPIVRMDEKEYFRKFDSKYKETLEKISSGNVSINDFKKLVIYDRQRELFSRGEYQPKDNSEFEGKNFFECYKKLEMNNENKKTLAEIVQFLDCRNNNWKNELRSNLNESERAEFESLIKQLNEENLLKVDERRE